MMTGHPFMRGQGGKVIKRPVRQVIGVDDIVPGLPAFRIAVEIASRCVGFLYLFRAQE